jgi:hypothetical protein
VLSIPDGVQFCNCVRQLLDTSLGLHPIRENGLARQSLFDGNNTKPWDTLLASM